MYRLMEMEEDECRMEEEMGVRGSPTPAGRQGRTWGIETGERL